MEPISIDDFKKVEIRVGEILSAETIEKSEKLLKLSVSFGLKTISALVVTTEPGAEPVEPAAAVAPELEIRQVLSGIAAYYPEPGALVGKRVAFITNLVPRMMMGLESQAMILATGGDGETPFTLFETTAPAGAQAR